MRLPIDVVAGSRPLRFKWIQRVDSVGGVRTVDYEGTLVPSVEWSICELITLCKQQAQQIKELQRIVNELTDRVAAQSELLAKKAEKPAEQPAQSTMKVPPPAPFMPGRKKA